MSEQRAAVELTRTQVAAILAAGAKAGADKSAVVTACPYSAAGDATERVRAAAWVRGFLGARRT